MAKRTFLNQRHRDERLIWAREHLTWTQAQWQNVLNTDEVRICLRHVDGRRRVWRGVGERYQDFAIQPTAQARGGSIMFWAGISADGRTDLVEVHGNITSQSYIADILRPHVLPYAGAVGNDFVLQDDNARPHRGRIVNDFLDNEGIERMEWPPYSADVSPIENLWSYLKKKIHDDVTPQTTLREIPAIAQGHCTAIPQPMIRTLINSMRRRCRAVINANRGYIRY